MSWVAPARPLVVRTWTPISSAWDRAAMRAPRRKSRSPLAAPVRATTTRSRVEQRLDVLPALLVAGTGHIGVGQLVDQRDLGGAGQHGVDVHLLEVAFAVGEAAAGHDLEVANLLRRPGPVVGFQVADHDIGAPLVAPPALVEHGERLADPRCRAQGDAKSAPRPRRFPATGTGLEVLGQRAAVRVAPLLPDERRADGPPAGGDEGAVGLAREGDAADRPDRQRVDETGHDQQRNDHTNGGEKLATHVSAPPALPAAGRSA